MNSSDLMYLILGAVIAAAWSFLMAYFVAGPRAKRLMIGTLRGDTKEDKEIVLEIREQLVRPELISMRTTLPEMPDLEPIKAEIQELKESIPEVDFSELEGKIDSFKEELPSLLGRQFEMHMKNLEAQEAKKMKSMLDDMDFDGVIEEKKADIVSKLSKKQKLGLRLMKFKIPKSYKDESPMGHALLEEGRLILGEALVTSEDEEAEYAGQQYSGRSGGGWNSRGIR